MDSEAQERLGKIREQALDTDPLYSIFTSGSTGVPKGVPLTYKNEAAAALNINAYIGNTSDDIELLALPVSHSFGLGRVRCCLSNGQTLHLLGSFVNVKRIYRTIEEENITGFTMVPHHGNFFKRCLAINWAIMANN